MTARPTDPTRRTVLATATAAAGAIGAGALLSACAAPAAAPVPAPGPAPASGGPAPSAGAGSTPRTLAALAAVPVGSAISATGPDGRPAIVGQPTAGTAVAFSAICTHMGCTVAPAAAELHCPCHGSRYSAATGAVLHGPAPRPLAAIAVTVVDGQVVAS